MRTQSFPLLLSLLLAVHAGLAQSGFPRRTTSVPTFTGSFSVQGKPYSYTMVGRSPELGGTTTIPTVLVPISLAFDGYTDKDGKKLAIDAGPDVATVLRSPVFRKFAFATGNTQYGDAVQRAEFYRMASKNSWHTLLGQPRVAPTMQIDIPLQHGLVLHSKRTGHSLAIVDLQYVQKELFQQLSKTNAGPGTLVIVLTKNVAFYALGDATVCCSWGIHGVQSDPSSSSGQSFVIGSYLDADVAPRYSDVQGLTEQIAEWMNDPLRGDQTNRFPAWLWPPADLACGGIAEGTSYRFAEPTDGQSLSNATSVDVNGTTYHLENVALLSWFSENSVSGSFAGAYSFPDTHALTEPAQPCSLHRQGSANPTVSPIPQTRPAHGHQLIGYWEGDRGPDAIPLRDVAPQWDVIIIAFASPVKGSTSLLHFETPAGETEDQFKSDIAYLQGKGKKVLISLGGGGEVVTLNTAADVHDFVGSVSAVVRKYGFDGVDLDLETPSLILNPGDTDFRKPTTPSVVNLIAAMHRLRAQFGPRFMIAEVPEGPQVPAGMEVYGGQFGSFLPVIYGTRHILSFVDVQDYNTPPLEGLDGNYYMPGTSDYHVAMTELLLHGFPVAYNPRAFFPPLPPEKVAIGFLVAPDTSVPEIENALRYLIEGTPYAGGEYKLRQPAGYPTFNGAMFWAIHADRRNDYRFSNAIGPFLHNLPASGGKAPHGPVSH